LKNKKNSVKSLCVLVLFVMLSNVVAIALAQTAEKKTYGGTIVCTQGGDPATLNPVLNTDQIYLVQPYFDYLVEYDYDGKVRPSLATKYEISSDGKTYTFTLAQGVKFHDGKELTSEDVKYTYDKALDPKTASGHVIFIGGVEAVEAPSKYVVVFRLSRPIPWLLDGMAQIGILPKHIYEKENFMNTKYNYQVIGSGPFKLERWLRLDQIVGVANENYWKGRPYVDRVIFKIITETAVALSAVESGDADIISNQGTIGGFPMANLPKLRENPRLNIEMFPTVYLQKLYFTCDVPPFNNVKVRQAVAHLVDRQYIIDTLLYKMAPLAIGPWPAALDWASSPKWTSETYYKPDQAKAEALLDEAGYKRGSDGIRFRTTIYATTGFRTDMSEIMRSMLAKAGIEAKVVSADWTTYWTRIRYKHDEVNGLYSVYDDYIDPHMSVSEYHSSLIGGGGENGMRYNNPKVDELIDKGKLTSDRNERAKIYKELHDIINTELPSFSLYELPGITVSNKRIAGIKSIKGSVGGTYVPSMWRDAWIPSAAPTTTATITTKPPEKPSEDMTPLILAATGGAVVAAIIVGAYMRTRKPKSSA